MRKTSSMLAAVVVAAVSTAVKIAATQFLRVPAVPPIQFTMPTAAPLPKFELSTSSFSLANPPQFPSPDVILGRAQAASRSVARAEPARPARRSAPRPAERRRAQPEDPLVIQAAQAAGAAIAASGSR